MDKARKVSSFQEESHGHMKTHPNVALYFDSPTLVHLYLYIFGGGKELESMYGCVRGVHTLPSPLALSSPMSELTLDLWHLPSRHPLLLSSLSSPPSLLTLFAPCTAHKLPGQAEHPQSRSHKPKCTLNTKTLEHRHSPKF